MHHHSETIDAEQIVAYQGNSAQKAVVVSVIQPHEIVNYRELEERVACAQMPVGAVQCKGHTLAAMVNNCLVPSGAFTAWNDGSGTAMTAPPRVNPGWRAKKLEATARHDAIAGFSLGLAAGGIDLEALFGVTHSPGEIRSPAVRLRIFRALVNRAIGEQISAAEIIEQSQLRRGAVDTHTERLHSGGFIERGVPRWKSTEPDFVITGALDQTQVSPSSIHRFDRSVSDETEEAVMAALDRIHAKGTTRFSYDEAVPHGADTELVRSVLSAMVRRGILGRLTTDRRNKRVLGPAIFSLDPVQHALLSHVVAYVDAIERADQPSIEEGIGIGQLVLSNQVGIPVILARSRAHNATDTRLDHRKVSQTIEQHLAASPLTTQEVDHALNGANAKSTTNTRHLLHRMRQSHRVVGVDRGMQTLWGLSPEKYDLLRAPSILANIGNDARAAAIQLMVSPNETMTARMLRDRFIAMQTSLGATVLPSQSIGDLVDRRHVRAGTFTTPEARVPGSRHSVTTQWWTQKAPISAVHDAIAGFSLGLAAGGTNLEALFGPANTSGSIQSPEVRLKVFSVLTRLAIGDSIGHGELVERVGLEFSLVHGNVMKLVRGAFVHCESTGRDEQGLRFTITGMPDPLNIPEAAMDQRNGRPNALTAAYTRLSSAVLELASAGTRQFYLHDLPMEGMSNSTARRALSIMHTQGLVEGPPPSARGGTNYSRVHLDKVQHSLLGHIVKYMGDIQNGDLATIREGIRTGRDLLANKQELTTLLEQQSARKSSENTSTTTTQLRE